MISLRSFCNFPSRLLDAIACVWLYVAVTSMVALPALAQGQTAAPKKEQAVLVLLAAIALAALMVLLRRVLFRWLLRPALRGLLRRLRSLLRLGGRVSARQRPAASLLSLGVGAIADGATETEDAIYADAFDASSVKIERNTRLLCSWIRPHYDRQADYHTDDAEEDFEKARQLFGAEVPLMSNPLNLYDDIHNAFIVTLLSKSDKPCFHILSEFRKAINANVLAITVTYTLIVSLVLVGNLTVPTSIEFYQRLGLGVVLPPSIPFFGVEASTRLPRSTS